MKFRGSWMRNGLAATVAAVAIAAAVIPVAGHADEGKVTVYPRIQDVPGWQRVASHKFRVNPNDIGEYAMEAVLWGDPKSGEHAVLNEWGNNVQSGWITRASDARIVVVFGTLNIIAEGFRTREVTPGGYMVIPKGVKHMLRGNPMGKVSFVIYQNGPAGIQDAAAP